MVYKHTYVYIISRKKKHDKMFSTIEFSPNQQNGLHLLLAHNASYTLSPRT